MTRLASAGPTGVGNGVSRVPAIGANGNTVAFASGADNLVPGDTNAATDVFVKDLDSGVVVRVSVSSAGVQGDDHSGAPDISADGRLVVFDSFAGNFGAGGIRTSDVFLHDRDSDEDQIFDEVGQIATYRLSQNLSLGAPNGHSWEPSITEYGSRIVFMSDASNLVIGDTNARFDVFVVDIDYGVDRQIGTIGKPLLISKPASTMANDASFSPRVSGDGSVVTFTSAASNLVTGDTNSANDVFAWTSATDAVSRVSEGPFESAPNGASSEASPSFDGRFIAFSSDADNLVAGAIDGNQKSDIYVRDLLRSVTRLVSATEDGSAAAGASREPSVFYGGASLRYHGYRLYDEGAPDEVVDPIYPLADATPTLMVAFTSAAADLVDPEGLGAVPPFARGLVFEGDTNGAEDVFVRDVDGQRTTRISTGSVGEQGTLSSTTPSANYDGSRIAFQTRSSFDVGDTNVLLDVYVVDLDACHSGAEEDGPVTSETHELERYAVGAQWALHEGGCRAGREGL